MVQMTHARTFNPQTKEWLSITAKEYTQRRDELRAREEAGELECHCPDPHCNGVRLKHYADRLHTYYDPRTGLPYRLQIPSYFQRMQGAQPHHPDCEIVKQYGAFQSMAHRYGGLALSGGSFLFNLNIPHMQVEGPVRPAARSIAEPFVRSNGASPDRSAHPKRRLSQGMKDLAAFGHVLERAAFDPAYRGNLLFRNGQTLYTLEQLYQETPYDLFTRAYRAPAGGALLTAVSVFKPAALPQFWKRGKTGPGTIFGARDTARGKDGKSYNVATVLHVENRELYARIKEQFHAGNPSFMVYSEKIYVDRAEIRERNIHARKTGENKAFHVHVHITRPEQIIPWSAPGAQKELDLQPPVFDLRTAGQRRRDAGMNPGQP
jgi:hypothetical protein